MFNYLSSKSVSLGNLFLRATICLHHPGITISLIVAIISAYPSLSAASESVTWKRVVYYDADYPSSWVSGTTIRNALSAEGYSVLNANELKQWMDDRIDDGHLSVVVFAKDIAPDTVAESKSSGCTLRRYLNAGGKIVWYGDIPCYYQGHSDGTRTNWGTNGSETILGFHAASGPWDSDQEVTITADGTQWGIQNTWPSVRPTATGGLRVLARDNGGYSAAWVKHYITDDQLRGFVRFRDKGGNPDAGDVQRLAEYAPATVLGDNCLDDIIATFHYPWYGNPNTTSWRHWNDATHNPPTTWTAYYLPCYPDCTWNPAEQLYDSNNIDVLRWQDRGMARAGIDIAIASWWGTTSFSNGAFSKAVRICKSVQWCIYYELDSKGDPTPQEIHDDIKYVIDNYGPTRNYAKIDGKWLVFVYAVNGTDAADRWRQAKSLLATSGYDVYFNGDVGQYDSSNVPDPWDAVHRYAPANYQTLTTSPSAGDDSASLSPGFWKIYETVRLARSLSQYSSAWNDIVTNRWASRFKVIETWNEIHEGTQIEPGQEIIADYVNGFQPSGYIYDYDFIDAIAPMANTLRWQSIGHRATASVKFEAENMVWENGTSAEGVTEWRINNEGARIGFAVYFPENQNQVWLIVRARAVQVGGSAYWPDLITYWDDVPVMQSIVDSLSHLNYFTTTSASSGIHKLEVTLANDPGEDEDVDLIIDCVDVHNVDADSDYDNDGIADLSDNCPLTANADQNDEDSDGVGDVCDECPGTLYGAPVDTRGCPMTAADFDRDGDVDQEDYGYLQGCFSGMGHPRQPDCQNADLDSDMDVDLIDFGIFQSCMNGADILPGC
ncbi:MAG: hypothetical protein JSV03_16230 [Planctomycetota bacterium]|nr:MAG: hypothetical protein JSV03_16230 [Planctomycetota bacterium]